MFRMIATLVLCVVAPTLAVAGTPTWVQHPSKNKPRRHVMVQFTDATLHPSIAQVLEGGTVSWVNYAAEYQGAVVISKEVAAALTCTDLRPDWSEIAAGYQSIPITLAGATNDVDLPCPLKPGDYEYELWLFSGPGYGGSLDPQLKMQGKIIVGPAKTKSK